jgi:hypothetical protein
VPADVRATRTRRVAEISRLPKCAADTFIISSHLGRRLRTLQSVVVLLAYERGDDLLSGGCGLLETMFLFGLVAGAVIGSSITAVAFLFLDARGRG